MLEPELKVSSMSWRTENISQVFNVLATGHNYGSIHSHDMPGSKRGWDEATLFCGLHKKRSERYVDLSGVDLVGIEGLITKKIIKKNCIKLYNYNSQWFLYHFMAFHAAPYQLWVFQRTRNFHRAQPSPWDEDPGRSQHRSQILWIP